MASLRTKLVFERFTREQGMIERREVWSKSFTKQLWEMMYVASAQIAEATPRTGVTDALGQLRSLTHVGGVSANISGSNIKGLLACIAPGGESGIYVPTGAGHNPAGSGVSAKSCWMKGDILGIVIGGLDTVVSPIDFKMASKINHGVRQADAVAANRMDFTGVDNSNRPCFSTSWAGVLFAVREPFILTKVKAQLFRTGSPGNGTMSLAGTTLLGSTDYYPSVDVAYPAIATSVVGLNGITSVSPGVLIDFPFTPVALLPGVIYCLYLQTQGATAANKVDWRVVVASGSQYAFATTYTSNSGAGWIVPTNEYSIIQLDGTIMAEVQYGGTEIRGVTVANPNAQFSISRNFYNGSGANVVIRECGIYAAGQRTKPVSGSPSYTPWSGDNYPFCIARDLVVPIITLLNGQTLQITYIPQVTV